MNLEEFLPTDRRWAVAQAGVLTIAIVWALAQVVLPSGPVAAAAAPDLGPTYLPITREQRTQLLALFPATATRNALSTATTKLDELGLVLESRRVEVVQGPKFPPREVHRIRVSGDPSQQIHFLRCLLRGSAPIRVREFTWSSGERSDRRDLEVVLEILTLPIR